jgi:hypothetical protein
MRWRFLGVGAILSLLLGCTWPRLEPPRQTLAPSTTRVTVTAQITASPAVATATQTTATLPPTPAPTQKDTPPATTVVPTAAVTQPRPVILHPPAHTSPGTPLSYETTVTLLAYDYRSALRETAPGDPRYPYPGLDFEALGPPQPVSYQGVVLENGYVALTILPELGGRIYRWVDKATGAHLLYENPEVHPRPLPGGGWWLPVGGIAWLFPSAERGLADARPWEYETGFTAHGLSVTVWHTEERTGMQVGATISLDADHAYVTLQPWAQNDGDAPQPYQLWLNGLLALSVGGVSQRTRIILPVDRVLPDGEETAVSWPERDGSDLSWYGEWGGAQGFFVPEVSYGFVGLYDPVADQGMVRVFSPGWPAGTRLSSATSGDEGEVIELWSGATPDFSTGATLAPGERASWIERWYPVYGIGAFTYANESAALRLAQTETGVQVGLAVSAATTGHLSLWDGGRLVASWPVWLAPGEAFQAVWTRPAGATGSMGLKLEDVDGVVLAQTGDGF